TQFAAHDPAPIRTAFASDLLRAAPLTSRMKQFNPITVNQAQQRGFDQKAAGPLAMRIEQSEQPRSLWQVGKQTMIVAHQPTIESSVSHSFQRKQQGQCDHFTPIQVRLAVLSSTCHSVIDSTEQF